MKNLKYLLPIVFTSLLLSACGGDSKSSPGTTHSSSAMSSSSMVMSSSSSSSTGVAKFQVTVTNLTAGQPLSPTAVLLHKPAFKAFTVGMPASLELERIAESGDAAAFLEDASTRDTTYVTGQASGGISPGASASIMLETPLVGDDENQLRLTAISMLGNTNDGFTGLNSLDISNLAPGSSMTLDTISYDAGTEKNTETIATVPGPAAGGEGFNPQRDDSPATVAMHAGVLTKDDGNPASALTSIHRWDNPVARIVITRLEP